MSVPVQPYETFITYKGDEEAYVCPFYTILYNSLFCFAGQIVLSLAPEYKRAMSLLIVALILLYR